MAFSKALQKSSMRDDVVAFNVGRKRAIRDICQGMPMTPGLVGFIYAKEMNKRGIYDSGMRYVFMRGYNSIMKWKEY